MALIQIAYSVTVVMIDIFRTDIVHHTNIYLLIEVIVRTVVAIISLSLGLISLFQKESKIVRPIIGIISAFILIGPILGILKVITKLLWFYIPHYKF